MTLSNLLKCRLCDNVDLVLLCISRVLQCMTVLQMKILNKVSVKRLIFYKSDTFTAEMEKVLSESWAKQGIYCTVKTLSCNRWTAMWLRQHQKWPVKQKKPYISTPVVCVGVFSLSICFVFQKVTLYTLL